MSLSETAPSGTLLRLCICRPGDVLDDGSVAQAVNPPALGGIPLGSAQCCRWDPTHPRRLGVLYSSGVLRLLDCVHSTFLDFSLYVPAAGLPAPGSAALPAGASLHLADRRAVAPMTHFDFLPLPASEPRSALTPLDAPPPPPRVAFAVRRATRLFVAELPAAAPPGADHYLSGARVYELPGVLPAPVSALCAWRASAALAGAPVAALAAGCEGGQLGVWLASHAFSPESALSLRSRREAGPVFLRAGVVGGDGESAGAAPWAPAHGGRVRLVQPLHAARRDWTGDEAAAPHALRGGPRSFAPPEAPLAAPDDAVFLTTGDDGRARFWRLHAAAAEAAGDYAPPARCASDGGESGTDAAFTVALEPYGALPTDSTAPTALASAAWPLPHGFGGGASVGVARSMLVCGHRDGVLAVWELLLPPRAAALLHAGGAAPRGGGGGGGERRLELRLVGMVASPRADLVTSVAISPPAPGAPRIVAGSADGGVAVYALDTAGGGRGDASAGEAGAAAAAADLWSSGSGGPLTLTLRGSAGERDEFASAFEAVRARGGGGGDALESESFVAALAGGGPGADAAAAAAARRAAAAALTEAAVAVLHRAVVSVAFNRWAPLPADADSESASEASARGALAVCSGRGELLLFPAGALPGDELAAAEDAGDEDGGGRGDATDAASSSAAEAAEALADDADWRARGSAEVAYEAVAAGAVHSRWLATNGGGARDGNGPLAFERSHDSSRHGDAGRDASPLEVERSHASPRQRPHGILRRTASPSQPASEPPPADHSQLHETAAASRSGSRASAAAASMLGHADARAAEPPLAAASSFVPPPERGWGAFLAEPRAADAGDGDGDGNYGDEAPPPDAAARWLRLEERPLPRALDDTLSSVARRRNAPPSAAPDALPRGGSSGDSVGGGRPIAALGELRAEAASAVWRLYRPRSASPAASLSSESAASSSLSRRRRSRARASAGGSLDVSGAHPGDDGASSAASEQRRLLGKAQQLRGKLLGALDATGGSGGGGGGGGVCDETDPRSLHRGFGAEGGAASVASAALNRGRAGEGEGAAARESTLDRLLRRRCSATLARAAAAADDATAALRGMRPRESESAADVDDAGLDASLAATIPGTPLAARSRNPARVAATLERSAREAARAEIDAARRAAAAATGGGETTGDDHPDALHSYARLAAAAAADAAFEAADAGAPHARRSRHHHLLAPVVGASADIAAEIERVGSLRFDEEAALRAALHARGVVHDGRIAAAARARLRAQRVGGAAAGAATAGDGAEADEAAGGDENAVSSVGRAASAAGAEGAAQGAAPPTSEAESPLAADRVYAYIPASRAARAPPPPALPPAPPAASSRSLQRLLQPLRVGGAAAAPSETISRGDVITWHRRLRA